MNEMIEIQWTAGSIDEVRKVCRFLVQERLVASAQIVPWVESISLLNNQIETTQETKAIFKTKKSLFEKVQDVIQKNCKYEIPEITSTDILQINPTYLAWADENVRIQ
jgi:periplasmic divalent cation tolerance protein